MKIVCLRAWLDITRSLGWLELLNRDAGTACLYDGGIFTSHIIKALCEQRSRERQDLLPT